MATMEEITGAVRMAAARTRYAGMYPLHPEAELERYEDRQTFLWAEDGSEMPDDEEENMWALDHWCSRNWQARSPEANGG